MVLLPFGRHSFRISRIFSYNGDPLIRRAAVVAFFLSCSYIGSENISVLSTAPAVVLNAPATRHRAFFWTAVSAAIWFSLLVACPLIRVGQNHVEQAYSILGSAMALYSLRIYCVGRPQVEPEMAASAFTDLSALSLTLRICVFPLSAGSSHTHRYLASAAGCIV
jgi:hypothetical protein